MNKIKIPFFAVVITVFVIILTTTGIIRLCKQPASANKEGDVGEYKISYAKEVLEVGNIVDNVPFLSEHFFMVCNDAGEPYTFVLRAETSWYNKNFDESGKAKEPVTVRFLVRKPSSDKAKVLSQINAEIVGEEIPWWHEGDCDKFAVLRGQDLSCVYFCRIRDLHSCDSGLCAF